MVKCNYKHLYMCSCVCMYMCNYGYGHVNMDMILQVHIKNVWLFSNVDGQIEWMDDGHELISQNIDQLQTWDELEVDDILS